MTARELTFEEILAGTAVHVTPSFQRSYAGAEETVAKRIAEAARPDGVPHLLGALVTRELAGLGGVRKALLIDGNQRLATLLVASLALRDRLRDVAPADAKRLDAALFVNIGTPPAARFKCLVAKTDRAAFEAAVEGRPFPDPNHPMARTYAAAASAVAKIPQDALPALARSFPTAFSFTVFALAPDDDPYPVFRLFNMRDDKASRIGLDTYRQFSSDPELMDLVAGGESQEVEFKAHAVMPPEDGKNSGGPRAVGSVVRAVAAMLNSEVGGTLLIGVEDDGAICGVEGEYALADSGKPTWDGWQLRLANVLRSRLSSQNAYLHCTIERRHAGEHDVCLVRILPSDEPVYIDKRFYVRTSAQTIEMVGPDLVEFVARRFPRPR